MKDCTSGHEGRIRTPARGRPCERVECVPPLDSFRRPLLRPGPHVSAQLLPHGRAGSGRGVGQERLRCLSRCRRQQRRSRLPEARRPERALSLRPAAGLQGAGPSTRERGHGSDGREPDATSQMRDVSAYFAAQIPRDTGPQSAPASPKLLAQGQSIYRQGIAGNAPVPACASCHALSGAGLPPEFPRLAGQHEQYLVKQLDDSARIGATAIPTR